MHELSGPGACAATATNVSFLCQSNHAQNGEIMQIWLSSLKWLSNCLICFAWRFAILWTAPRNTCRLLRRYQVRTPRLFDSVFLKTSPDHLGIFVLPQNHRHWLRSKRMNLHGYCHHLDDSCLSSNRGDCIAMAKVQDTSYQSLRSLEPCEMHLSSGTSHLWRKLEL